MSRHRIIDHKETGWGDPVVWLWCEHFNPRKAGKVLLVVGIDAGDPVGQHGGHEEKIKDVLAG